MTLLTRQLGAESESAGRGAGGAARRPIRALPDLVANQIAAGEVVERPASVVKELVDNAIDAGATRIVVELEQGGVELVRVSDDGAGIPEAELPLAIAPHATSKIDSAADLDRITTLGFRGEALASIASVSRLTIRSRTAEMTGAAALDVEGDRAAAVRPDAGSVGTSVTVRNLFFNTPARRKFLRTAQTESGHCTDVVRDLALAHPAIGFTLKVDGRVTIDVPPGQGPRERALALLGRELEGQYVEVHADAFDDTRGVALWGLAGLPAIARGTNKSQHIFLNGRPIRDKTVQHAIKEAYRGLIEPSRYPSVLVMIEMDPGAVDVNVHPAKAEVRFRDSGIVHSVVLRSLREALKRADLTPRVESPGGSPSAMPGLDEGRQRFVDYFRSVGPGPGAAGRIFDFEATQLAARAPGSAPVVVRATEAPVASEAELPKPRVAPRVLQVHNSYLVTQDEQGVLIIDQHALHERVMFERLKERLADKGLESQRLLMPSIIEMPAQRLALLETLRPMFEKLGLAVEPIGPASAAVQAFPTFLFDRKVDPVEFVGELLERAEAESWDRVAKTGGTEEESALHEVLDMMACKAAVKAGDALSETELGELLTLRDSIERASNCPHGRPTTIRVTIRDLEKLFGRS